LHLFCTLMNCCNLGSKVHFINVRVRVRVSVYFACDVRFTCAHVGSATSNCNICALFDPFSQCLGVRSSSKHPRTGGNCGWWTQGLPETPSVPATIGCFSTQKEGEKTMRHCLFAADNTTEVVLWRWRHLCPLGIMNKSMPGFGPGRCAKWIMQMQITKLLSTKLKCDKFYPPFFIHQNTVISSLSTYSSKVAFSSNSLPLRASLQKKTCHSSIAGTSKLCAKVTFIEQTRWPLLATIHTATRKRRINSVCWKTLKWTNRLVKFSPPPMFENFNAFVREREFKQTQRLLVRF